MAVFFYENGFVAPLKKMAGPLMQSIGRLCINAIQVPHPPRQIGLDGFNHDVVMISHQTPGMTNPVESLAGIGKYLQPQLPVIIACVNIFPPISTRRNVIQTAS